VSFGPKTHKKARFSCFKAELEQRWLPANCFINLGAVYLLSPYMIQPPPPSSTAAVSQDAATATNLSFAQALDQTGPEEVCQFLQGVDENSLL
jgi:hypothetical protein